MTDRGAISPPPLFSRSMRRNSIRSLFRVVSAAFLVLSLCTPARAASPEDHPAVPAILARAESLFQSMKARDYPAIFAALSVKSRETIVSETVSAQIGRAHV